MCSLILDIETFNDYRIPVAVTHTNVNEKNTYVKASINKRPPGPEHYT